MGLKKRIEGAAAGLLVSPRTRALKRRLAKRQRAGRGGRRRVVFFHQAEDASSFLLAQVLPRFLAAYDVELEVVLVPAADASANPEPERRIQRFRSDALDLSRYLDLEMPEGPQAASPEAPSDALIHRVNAVLALDRSPSDQLAAIVECSRALWAGDLSRMTALEKQLGGGDPSQVAATLLEGHARLHAAGHYHGGMLLYEGEWYWGVDRLHYLEERLQGEGLSKPSEPLVAKRPEDEWPKPEALPRDESGRVVLELFFSFRSPYSYLAVCRTRALAQELDLALVMRPVLPMVMRGMQVPRAKRFYIVKDTKREADRQGLAFGKISDPVGAGTERCLAVFLYAQREGKGAEFCEAGARGIWSQALDVATESGLRRVVENAGLVWADAQQALEDPAWRERAECNREALFALGLWGVPCFKLGDYVTWGQDRLWIIESLLRAEVA